MGSKHAFRNLGFAALGILFFVAYSYLPFVSPAGIFNSPDEMANAYFARTFVQRGTMTVDEPLEVLARGFIHPRSVAVRGSTLVPESFHGLPVLYGAISKIIGLGALPFLTAFIAVVTLFTWRRTIAVPFGERAGTLAMLLLGITPAWWYYANRGLYHNELFVSFLIFAAYFFIAQPIRMRSVPWMNAFIAGIFLGLAWWVRTSEIFWTITLAAALIITFRRSLTWQTVLAFVIGALIAFTPALIINHQLYAQALGTGYVLPVSNISTSVPVPVSVIHRILTLIAPFGIHPRTILHNVWNFAVALPWWMSYVTALALAWFGLRLLRGATSRNETVFVLLFLGVTSWLAVVYGSWIVHDNPDPNAVTFGISYARYWLPLSVLASGIMGVAAAKLPDKKIMLILPGAVALLMFALSFQSVFFTRGDGLTDIATTLHGYAIVKTDVMTDTPSDAIIVVDRSDKVFFPERRVITPLRNGATYDALGALAGHAPLFYYGITLTPIDFEHENRDELASRGLVLKSTAIYGNESLYQLVKP